jgi:hypothetical protein
MGILNLFPGCNASKYAQMDTGEILQITNAFKIALHYTQTIPQTCAWILVLMAALLIMTHILAKESASTANLWITKSV